MVSSVSGIGSFASSIFELHSSSSSQTTSGASFEDLVGNGKIKSDEQSSCCAAGQSQGGSQMGSESEMDLNHDGQVTADEVVKYMQMQMMDKMSEQMSSEDGSAEMNQQSQNSAGMEDYKNQLAARAYASADKLMEQVTDMISGCFMA